MNAITLSELIDATRSMTGLDMYNYAIQVATQYVAEREVGDNSYQKLVPEEVRFLMSEVTEHVIHADKSNLNRADLLHELEPVRIKLAREIFPYGDKESKKYANYKFIESLRDEDTARACLVSYLIYWVHQCMWANRDRI